MTAVAILRATGSGSPLGAYESATQSNYSVGTAVSWIGWHLVDVAILVCVSSRYSLSSCSSPRSCDRGERDVDVVALVSVTVAYLLTSVVLVGVFASGNVGQLGERDLISISPPLFIAFSVWLARSAPRPQPTSTIIGFSVAALASFLPVQRLVTPSSTPDAFMLVPLLKWREAVSTTTFEASWPLIVVALVLLVLFIPRRYASGLAILVIVALAVSAIFAQVEVDRRTASDRRTFFGSGAPNWIDRQVSGKAIYLYSNDRNWNRVWQTAYWNSRISSVAALSGERSFGPVPGDDDATLLEDGTMISDDRRMTSRLLIASSNIAVAGRPVASVRGGGEIGLTLWRASQPTRISYRVSGLPASGGTKTLVTVEVFGCDGGVLETTISGRRPGTIVNVGVDSGADFILRVPAGSGLTTRIPLPRLSGSRRMCFVTFHPRGRIHLGEIRRLAPVGRPTRPGPISSVAVVSPTPSRVGYCIGHRFLNLTFRQPEFDWAVHEATPAAFVQGRGLGCDDPPPGFVRRGLAPARLGVPEDVYPYYVPAPQVR